MLMLFPLNICFDHFLFKKCQACGIIMEISPTQHFKINVVSSRKIETDLPTSGICS